MNDLSIIDQFLAAFVRYIDAGFGLLGPDVSFLARTLIALDITLAGLFWALGGEDNVLGRLIRKVLYIGAFAYILNSFSTLSTIVFNSFAQAGLTAGGGTITADDLLRPGRVASTGFTAAWPLLQQVHQLGGFTTFFDNFPTIIVLVIAFVFVILSFFVLSIQICVTVLEFKISSLAGFILVPFALWNRTTFLSERVLGFVVSCGIKVMVIAVIVGIGTGFFSQFTTALQGHEPDLGQAMSLLLASLTMCGLGLFVPAKAAGLVAGAPQLGAGAALGTVLGAGGVAYLGGAGAAAAARGILGGGLNTIRAATSMGAAASTAYGLGQQGAGAETVGAGLGGVARAAGNAARARASSAIGFGEAVERGRSAALGAMTGTGESAPSASETDTGMPEWARAMKAAQANRNHGQAAAHATQQGDGGGAGATPDIKEKED